MSVAEAAVVMMVGFGRELVAPLSGGALYGKQCAAGGANRKGDLRRRVRCDTSRARRRPHSTRHWSPAPSASVQESHARRAAPLARDHPYSREAAAGQGLRSRCSRSQARMRLLSWNVNGRRGTALERQVAAVASRRPDLVALQEVRIASLDAWRARLGATVRPASGERDARLSPLRISPLLATRTRIRRTARRRPPTRRGRAR
jgi:hypothetical protein